MNRNLNGYIATDITGLSKYKKEMMGMATLMVMICHITNIFQNLPYELVFITSKGNLGVDIFVFLSGMGMFFALKKNPGLSCFYKRRFSRVLVPYLIIGIPFWIIDSLLTGSNLKLFLLNLTGISFWMGSGIKTIWYVAFIIAIYFISPLIYFLIFKKCEKKVNSSYHTLILAVFCCVVLNLIIYRVNIDYYQATEIAWSRLPIFIFGLGYGFVISDNKIVIHKKENIILVFIIPVIYLLTILCTDTTEGISGLILRITGGLFAVWVGEIACHVLERNVIKRLRKILAFFGNISLECYLVHVLILHLINDIIIHIYHIENFNYLKISTVVCIIIYTIIMIFCIGISYSIKKLENTL